MGRNSAVAIVSAQKDAGVRDRLDAAAMWVDLCAPEMAHDDNVASITPERPLESDVYASRGLVGPEGARSAGWALSTWGG